MVGRLEDDGSRGRVMTDATNALTEINSMTTHGRRRKATAILMFGALQASSGAKAINDAGEKRSAQREGNRGPGSQKRGPERTDYPHE